MKQRFIIWLLSLCIILIATTHIKAWRLDNNDLLPTDLLFSADRIDAAIQFSVSELVRVDKNTLELSTFYTEPTTEQIIALAWSPNKQLLAIFRGTRPNPNSTDSIRRICILSRQGQLQRCFDEQLPFVENYREFDQLISVSWSSDNRFVYFSTETHTYSRLYQGDVTTGQTTIIAEIPQVATNRILLSWSPSLQPIIARMGFPAYPLILKQFVAGQFVDIPVISVDSGTICGKLSPIHSYITITNQDSLGDNIHIVDLQGNTILHIDDMGELGNIGFGCPIWSADEQYIYFIGHALTFERAQIFRYSLATGVGSVYFESQTNPPMARESFRTGEVLQIYDNYFAGVSAWIDTDLYSSQVNVVYPDKHTRGFLGNYRMASSPLWMPELPAISTNTPTFTTTPTSTSTLTPTATPTLAPTSTAGLLRLQYYPDPGRRSITVDSLEPDFRIMNPTSSAIPLSEFKIRYYFTKEGTSPLVFTCWYTSLPLRCNNIIGTFVTLPTPVNGADTYLEVGFTGTTESVPANGSTGEILVGIRKQDWSNFNQSNDYSFQSRPEVFSDWDHVTLYRNGSLVWGVVPQ